MQGEYREVNSILEIESILRESSADSFIVWQNMGDHRRLYPVETMSYDTEKRQIQLKLKEFKHDFDLMQVAYIKLEYRGTLFKAKILSMDGTYITIEYPYMENVKTIELRAYPRVPINIEDDILITLKIKQLTTLNESEHILKFQAYDISEQGICLLVSGSNRNFVEESFEIFIIQLGPIVLKQPVKIEKRYATDHRFKKFGKSQHSKRMGFKTEALFDPNEYALFLESIKR